jgi:cysteine desulfurase family protein (TIGR01976 family)
VNSPTARSLDLAWVRARFAALESEWALMDNAGGSAPLTAVSTRIAEYMQRWPVQLGASYGPSAQAGERQIEARRALAGMFATAGGPAPAPEQIAIGASTTSMLSRLARSLAPSFSPGDEIIVSDADHEANIGPWLRLAASGLRIRWWHIRRASMRLEIEDLNALLSARTRLICFTHASNLLGTAHDLSAVVSRARDCGARTCVDGVAFAPHRGLAAVNWGVDWYALSLYKTFGPHCALLYSAADAAQGLASLNHEWMAAADAATKLEPGACPYELAWGAAAVPEYLQEVATRHGGRPFDAPAAHEQALTARLLDWLGSRAGVRVLGAARVGPERLPTVSFVVEKRSPAEVVAFADRAGLGIRHGHFYAPRLVAALGLKSEGVVRVSLAHYNTLEEVDRLILALEPAL